MAKGASALRRELGELGGEKTSRGALRSFVKKHGLSSRATSRAQLYERIQEELTSLERQEQPKPAAKKPTTQHPGSHKRGDSGTACVDQGDHGKGEGVRVQGGGARVLAGDGGGGRHGCGAVRDPGALSERRRGRNDDGTPEASRKLTLKDITSRTPVDQLRRYVQQEGLTSLTHLPDARLLYHRIRSFHGLPVLERGEAETCVITLQTGGRTHTAAADVETHARAREGDAAQATLREAGVTSKERRVWQRREDRDMYTGITRSIYEDKDAVTQVDHVLEIQLLNHAWEEGVARNPRFPPAYNLRSSKARAISMQQANDVDNLNVTMSEINNKKRGPFTRWLNRYREAGGEGSTRELSLDEQIRASARADRTPQMETMLDMGIWDRIKRAVVRTYDDAADEHRQAEAMQAAGMQGGHRDAYEAYVDSLGTMLTRMDIS